MEQTSNTYNNDSNKSAPNSELTEAEKRAILGALLEQGKVIVIPDPQDKNYVKIYSSKPVDLTKVNKEDIIYLD